MDEETNIVDEEQDMKILYLMKLQITYCNEEYVCST